MDSWSDSKEKETSSFKLTITSKFLPLLLRYVYLHLESLHIQVMAHTLNRKGGTEERRGSGNVIKLRDLLLASV